MAQNQGNNGGNNGNAARPRHQVNQHIEFIVKAAEDLILEGKERTVTRVQAGTPYTCLMLKNQRFSSLFRHYAKIHGLKKEDLTYFFTEGLRNEDTPESVYLQARDEIIVKRRRLKSATEDADAGEDEGIAKDRYIANISAMRHQEDHMDVTFFVGEARTEVKAHKFILVSRVDYFTNMFGGSMREAITGEVNMEHHEPPTVRLMLEYLYTNSIKDLYKCTADHVAALLSLADEYQMADMKRVVETVAKGMVTAANVARLISASTEFHADDLHRTCMTFVQKNLSTCSRTLEFGSEVKAAPELALNIMQHISGMIPESGPTNPKKRRRADNEVVDP
ncbi:BTB/POZ protein [Tribonema minus]|uniref:BTB/POZ protein n=1 Tax=Tribonema minus TaxID=303371 RepID=A0A835Z1S1_9STRA|nr:BTB/POZ protein [Tribonema minus]